ncbi:hypothetical protein Q7P37_011042 [Cladosporium fusiforme]
MTTRRSAKSVSDIDMYPEDEYDDSESRRTSFDDASVETPYSGFDSEPPPKRQRTADPSPEQNRASDLQGDGPPVNGSHRSSGLFDTMNGDPSGSQTSSGGGFVSQMDVDASQNSIDPRLRDEIATGDDQDLSRPIHTTEDETRRPQSRSKLDEAPPVDDMRKPFENVNGATIDNNTTGEFSQLEPTQSQSQEFEVYQSPNKGKWAEVVDHLPSMKASASREASVESSRSDPRVVGEIAIPEISTDATPMATRQGSPATTASAAAEEVTPARSKTRTNLELAGTDEEDNDVQPATQNPDSVEGMEEEGEVTRYAEEYEEDDAPAQKPTKRRFAGGRRRAAHSNAYVEAAMRRQLELKQFYRQVTRSMKSCLGELAQITLDELATDPHHHEQTSEYETVMAGLNEQLERRKQQLLSAQKFNHEQLLQRFHAESDSRKNRCRNLLEDIKEQQLVNLEYNMLQVNRARLRDEPGHETEDEDGVIPRPKRMAYRFKRSNAIDSRYDSRSRFTMETERRIQDLECRTKMWEALKAFDTNPDNAFTVMDSSAREAAQERRRNVDMTNKLADAATEYDRRYNAPAPPQAPPPPTAAELAPLNQLADLAVKPSLLSQRSRLSSTVPGYPDQSPRQHPHSSLPSQFERSTATAPPHQPASSFLQVAMEPTRGPGHAFAPSSAPSLPSLGMRQLESGFNPMSSPMGRGVDGRPALAAKPAAYSGSERFPPSNPINIHPSNHQGLHNMGVLDLIHSDRARMHAEHANQEARAAARHSLSAAIGQKGNEAEQAHAEAARQNRSLPPPPSAGARTWPSPITGHADRGSLSGPEGGRRMKREREEDEFDTTHGRRTIPRNDPARARRSSQEAPEMSRGRHITERVTSEERDSVARQERASEVDMTVLNKPSNYSGEFRDSHRRNSQASAGHGTPSTWLHERRFSNQGFGGPHQSGQQTTRGPTGPMATPSAIGTFSTGSYPPTWPNSTGYVPPQAPAVNHLGNGQGLAGPFHPYQGPPPPPPQHDFGPGPFRDMNNRR